MNRLLVVLIAIVVLAVVYLIGYGQGSRSGAPLGGNGTTGMMKDGTAQTAADKELKDLGYQKQTTISGTVVSSSDSSFVMEVPIGGSLQRFTVSLGDGVELQRVTQKSDADVAAAFAAYDDAQSAYDTKVQALLDAYDPEDPEATPPTLPEPPTPPATATVEVLALTDLTAGDHVSITVDGDATGMQTVTASSIALQEAPADAPVPPPTDENGTPVPPAPFGNFSVDIITAPAAPVPPPTPPEPEPAPEQPPQPEPAPAS